MDSELMDFALSMLKRRAVASKAFRHDCSLCSSLWVPVSTEGRLPRSFPEQPFPQTIPDAIEWLPEEEQARANI